jgi:molecular chaperone HscB
MMASVSTEVVCWRCARRQPAAFFCSSCHALLPLPDGLDHFAVLGMTRSPALDVPALEERFHALSREIHPDRFQTASPQERAASLRDAAALNRAYRTLRDPVERGRYWLELGGERLGDGNATVPPTLAAEVFTVQERLEALRTARAGRGTDEVATLVAEVRRTRAELGARLQGLEAMLERAFAEWGDGPPDGRPELRAHVRSTLTEISYLRTLERDVEREIGDDPWNASLEST